MKFKVGMRVRLVRPIYPKKDRPPIVGTVTFVPAQRKIEWIMVNPDEGQEVTEEFTYHRSCFDREIAAPR